MIHFLPDRFEPEAPYHEAVARLASIRAALGVAERVAGVSGAALPSVPTAWPEGTGARQRRLESRSVESAQVAAAGLEMLAAQRTAGNEPHPQSVTRLAETLRAELTELNHLFSL